MLQSKEMMFTFKKEIVVGATHIINPTPTFVVIRNGMETNLKFHILEFLDQVHGPILPMES